MAKRAAKKVKKKSPVKKQTKAKSKKGGLSPLPPLKTCLKGKRIALAGRFSWPGKETIENFYKSCGGKIADKVDVKLDILLVDAGRKSVAQKKAEKLNASGDADILIIDKPIEAFPDFEMNRVTYLTTPDQLVQFSEIVKRNWLADITLSVIDGVKFSKETIGPNRLPKLQSWLDLSMDFANCCFDQTTIQNIHIGSSRDESHSCEFNRVIFNDARINSPQQCTFNKCKGTALEIAFGENCQLDGMAVDEIELSYSKGISISNSKFKVFELDGFSGHSTNFSLENIKIGLWKALGRSCDVINSEFSKVTVAKTKIDESLKCVGSTFKDCKICNLKSQSVDFQKCELINCTFDGLAADHLSFDKNTKLKNCRFVKPKIGQISISESQLAGTKGLPKTLKQFTPKSHPNLYKFAETLVKSGRLRLSFDAVYQKTKTVRLECSTQYGTDLSYEDPKSKQHSGRTEISCFSNPTEVNDVFRGLGWWIRASKASDVNFETIKIKTSKSPLKGKPLKELIIAAIFEGMGAEPRSADEIKSAQKESTAKSSEIKKAVKAELMAGEVKKLNKRTASERLLASPIKKVDFSGANFAGAKLAGFEFRQCNFADANLSKVDLSKGCAASCDFTNANLKEANLANCNLSKSVFDQTDATKAVLSCADFSQTKFNKSNFTNAKFSPSKGEGKYSFLSQTDLSSCILKGADLTMCVYNQRTRLPDDFPKTMLKKMHWDGPGLPPDKRKHLKKAAGPLDFDTFMERLNEITDSSRLKKSLKMLKADSFELFSEVEDDRVAGVVKSQSDAKLVYSCTLQEGGEFSCCTQNLNTCGGLRGSLCKHILVLLVGLAKSGELDPTKVDQWINASKMKTPELDKDRMGEVLLKYKGAEAGEIDWRPTETVPEDFMAF